MKKGKFINFILDYSELSDEDQAREILLKVNNLIDNNSNGVAITYSANYGQTIKIQQEYFAGNWITDTNGANQASVMSHLEKLLASSEFNHLQHKFNILPITTMNSGLYTNLWNYDFQLGIVITDLERISNYLLNGWDCLGWQNQNTIHQPNSPYAIGGGIVHLPSKISSVIQESLMNYNKKY